MNESEVGAVGSCPMLSMSFNILFHNTSSHNSYILEYYVVVVWTALQAKKWRRCCLSLFHGSEKWKRGKVCDAQQPRHRQHSWASDAVLPCQHSLLTKHIGVFWWYTILTYSSQLVCFDSPCVLVSWNAWISHCEADLEVICLRCGRQLKVWCRISSPFSLQTSLRNDYCSGGSATDHCFPSFNKWIKRGAVWFGFV